MHIENVQGRFVGRGLTARQMSRKWTKMECLLLSLAYLDMFLSFSFSFIFFSPFLAISPTVLLFSQYPTISQAFSIPVVSAVRDASRPN